YHVIASFYTHWYLDVGHAQWFANNSKLPAIHTWQHMYEHDPTRELTRSQIRMVLGGEVAIWSEMVNERNLDFLVWPRAAAAAERLWSSNELRQVDKMVMNRLHIHN